MVRSKDGTGYDPVPLLHGERVLRVGASLSDERAEAEVVSTWTARDSLADRWAEYVADTEARAWQLLRRSGSGLRTAGRVTRSVAVVLFDLATG